MTMLLQSNISLKPYTTFMTEATARYFCEVQNDTDFYELFENPEWKTHPHLVIGSGSNLLFTDNFDGIIVYVKTKGIKIIDETDDIITLKVAAGELWHSLVMFSVEREYWGIENLALIPGTVGAAPVQNIGAYGVEAKDTISQVEAINLDSKQLETFTNKECLFDYRTSMFKQSSGRYLVTSVSFTLSKKPKPHLEYGSLKQILEQQNITNPTIQDITDTVISVRQSKLPNVGEIGMAGSFFKNPVISMTEADNLQQQYPEMVSFPVGNEGVKISAGWLIENLGYKGIQKGNVGTYSKHALVLVNYGNATGKEVWDFAKNIMNEVFEKFSIHLEPEVIIIKNPEI